MARQHYARALSYLLLVAILLVYLAGPTTAAPAPAPLVTQLLDQMRAAERRVAAEPAATGPHEIQMVPVEAAPATGQQAATALTMLPEQAAAPARSDAAAASTMVAAAPRLRLEPAAAAPGQTVRLSGEQYAPGEPLRVFWGDTLLELPQLRADAEGRFSVELVVPESAAPGEQRVAAIEATVEGLAAIAEGAIERSSVAFTVLTQPAAPANPQAAPVAVQTGQAATPAATKEWTLAVYMSADTEANSSLNRLALENLTAMGLGGGSSDQVHVVALADVRNAPTRYYEILGGSSVTLLDRTPAAIQGRNLNTADPRTFVDFMGFVRDSYPARRYAMVLWSDGAGWKGVQSDDPANGFWSMADLRSALSGGLAQLGAERYELLLMDACFMAQYEVALEVSDLARVLVGSEEEVRSSGFPYQQIVSGLRANPGQQTEAFAQAIVAAYSAYYRRGGAGDWPYYTVSAIRLGDALTGLQERVNEFASRLVTLSRTQGGELTLISRNRAEIYRDTSFVDLGDFAAAVRDNDEIDDAALKSAANAVVAALRPGGVVLSEASGERSPGSTGMSIYFPDDPGKGLRKQPTAVGALAGSAGSIAPGYERLRVRNSPWFALLRGLTEGRYEDLAPVLPTTLPEVPPPAAASQHDLVFSRAVNGNQSDLYRLDSKDADAPALDIVRDGYINIYPRWSPDGALLAYVSNQPVAGGTVSGLERNLFLIRADGRALDPSGLPRPLTNYSIDCPNGPGTGQNCVTRQVFAPSWLSDGSGLLYTVVTYQLAFYPLYSVAQSIHVVDLTGDQGNQLLPNPIFGGLYDVQFTNADLKSVNGTADILLFSYIAPASDAYNLNFRNNNLGFIDFNTPTLGNEDLYGFFVNDDPQFVAAGNYLLLDWPAWRPGTDDILFLYNRRGNPTKLRGTDPRTAPPAGIWERQNPFYAFGYGPLVYQTYDVGIMSLERRANGSFGFVGMRAVFADNNARFGFGFNFQPSWQPTSLSRNVAASYSYDGGSTFDVALLDVFSAQPKPSLVTNNGSSFGPAWGRVLPSDVLGRLEVSPRFQQPGPSSSFYLSASGFQSGERIRFYETTGGGERQVAEGTANGRGILTVRVANPQARGPRSFVARGTADLAAAKTTNQDVLIPLVERSGLTVWLPLLRR